MNKSRQVKLSRAYIFLKKMGFNYPEDEYGQISFWDVVKRVLRCYRSGFLMKFMMNSWIFDPIAPRKLRPACLRKIGCNVGNDVFIGSQVWIDEGHAGLITIEDHAHLDARCIVLCHKRELGNYFIGDDYAKLPYKTGPVRLCKGCSVGTGTILMPGVTVGEGAIVGSGAIVTRDIPAWTIAVGCPAKVVRNIPQRVEE